VNQLVKELIRPLLEDEKKVTAIYGGGFKPPTKGHFDLVKNALKDFPEIDKFIIYVGSGTRDGIKQEQSLAIWDIYKEILGPKVEIIPSSSPIGDIVRYAKSHQDEQVYFTIGYREGRQDDLADITSRTKGVKEKYPNIQVKVMKSPGGDMSGTNARKSIGDKEKFFTYLPDEVPANEKEEVYNIVSKSLLKEHMAHTNTIDLLEKCAQLTRHMIEKGYNIEPLPGLSIIDDDVDNSQNFFGKTAYYDPNEQMIVLYTQGRHPKDIVRSYAHEMIHHIQNLEDRLGNIQTTNTAEDDHLDGIEREAYEEGNIAFRNWTDSLQEGKVKDPFGLNAFAYEMARLGEEIIGDEIKCDSCGWEWEITDGGDDLFICHKCGHDNTPHPLTEGRYDKFTNELSRLAFELIKDGYDVGRKVVDETFVVGPEDEDPDIVSNDFEFDFTVQATYTEDTYTVDGGANAGYDDEGDEITPLLNVRFEIPKNVDWQTVSFDLKDVIRHELEHLTQDGANVRAGKQMADDQLIRNMVNAKLLPKKEYFKLEKEVDAMLQGLYLKAKKSKTPFKEVILDYFDKVGLDDEERKEVLDFWRNRRKALALPMFEEQKEKPKKYTIFCDMDGVLVDFDKGYKDLTGMSTQHADAQGRNEFWSIFRQGLKDSGESEKNYWANLDWMPDGVALWNYIKEYNPYVLTAPSVNFDLPDDQRYKAEYNESMQGKLDWVKRLPNMRKIYFAAAKNKAKFAGPNKILIDDRKDTIDAWNANGGIGILHKNAADTIQQLEKLGL
jgi:hypothetical protein